MCGALPEGIRQEIGFGWEVINSGLISSTQVASSNQANWLLSGVYRLSPCHLQPASKQRLSQEGGKGTSRCDLLLSASSFVPSGTGAAGMLLAWPLVSHSSSRADGEAPRAAHVVLFCRFPSGGVYMPFFPSPLLLPQAKRTRLNYEPETCKAASHTGSLEQRQE